MLVDFQGEAKIPSFPSHSFVMSSMVAPFLGNVRHENIQLEKWDEYYDQC